MYDGYKLADESLAELFRLARQDAHHALKHSDSLAEKHNRFCLYSLLSMFYATGARPVCDPLHDLGTMNLEHGVVSMKDKETHEYVSLHFVGLGELAIQQGVFYNEHLKGLASQYMTQYGSRYNLVRGIARLTQEVRKATVPRYFLINGDRTESITPKLLADYLSEFIPLPPNFNRHAMTTALASGNEHIAPFNFNELSAFLGHQPIGTHLFGPDSELTLTEVLESQAIGINHVLKSIGFTPLKGLKAHNKELIISGRFAKEKNLHMTEELGPHRRARIREEKESADVILANEIAAYITESENGRTSSTIAIRLKQNLVNSNYPVGPHWQSLISKHGGSPSFFHVLPKTKRKLSLSLDRTPYSDSTLPSYLSLRSLRKQWLFVLNKWHTRSAEDEITTRVAMIIITSALFGGLVTLQKLQALIQSIHTHTFQTNQGLLYIELSDLDSEENTLLRRWFPDRLSATLILGLRRRLKNKTIDLPNEDEVAAAVTELLKEIDISTSSRECLKRLSKVTSVSAGIEYPAYLREFILGNSGTAISHSAWIRLTTNLVPALETTATEVEIGDWLPSLRSNKQALSDLKQVKQAVNSLFSQKRTDSAQGKHELTQSLKAISNQFQDAPDICHLIIGWAVSLCISGTVKAGTSAAISTINNYVSLVMNAVLSMEACTDFFDLDEMGYENFYSGAVDGATQENQCTLVVQLQLFHSWVTENYEGAEDCDWSPVWENANRIRPKVSANIITEHEYHRALDLIDLDQTLNERRLVQRKGLLIILRKFGVRFGEAYYLRREDIQHLDDWSLVTLQINRIGGRQVKSENGIRQVNNIERLSEREIAVLRALTSDYFSEAIDSPIMSEASNSLERVPKRDCSAYLNLLIKAVTQDSIASLKHLRHGYGSSVHAAVVAERFNETVTQRVQPWLDRNIDLYNLTEGMNQKPVKYLSQAMGHSAIPTTLYSYIHSLDLCPHAGDLLNLDEEFSAKAMACLLGESFDAYRKRKVHASGAIQHAIKTTRLPFQSDGENFEEFNLDRAQENLKTYKAPPILPGVVSEVFFYVLTRSPNQKFIPAALNINRQQFWDICNIGDRLENDTNYDEYIMVNASENSLDRIERLVHPNISQQARMRTFFRDYETVFLCIMDSELDLLKRACRIWCDAIQPKKHRLKINFEERFHVLKELFSFFSIVLEVSTCTDPKPHVVVERDSIRRQREARRPDIAYKLNFRTHLRSNKDSINSESDLHRAMFIISAWLNFQERNNEQNNQFIQSGGSEPPS